MNRDQLVVQYEPYVRSIAGKIKKTLSKEIEFDDLVEYGMVGLLEAAERFDAKFGANFMTFSYYRIRGAIYDGLRGMGWMSRTEYARVRFEEKSNSYLGNQSDRQAGAVGEKEGDDVQNLAEVVSGLAAIFVTTLDGLEGLQIRDENEPLPEEKLGLAQARKLVRDAIAKLNEQERQLLELYYYRELSLQEVGEQLGLSKSWTSRLHARAIDKLQRLLRDSLGD
jgi:RNA polymerase sigma factor for flagellar operon FliA